MSTINQIRANRRNAKKSSGPTSIAGKQKTSLNALVHGIRADTLMLPGEDREKYNLLVAGLHEAWQPKDDMETSLVQQIATNQWKLARIDRHEARLNEDTEMSPVDLATAIHRLYLTQGRLERSISQTITDLARYRAERIARQDEDNSKEPETLRQGLLWTHEDGGGIYAVLPQVLGLDGVWREIPREILGDFSKSPKPPTAA